MRSAVVVGLLVAAAPVSARERLAHVRFVGCPADGQTGPIEAPKSGPTPTVPVAAAPLLAYYSDENQFGVLAPRGWHCVKLYGSSGELLIVTPKRHLADEFFQERPANVRGPAIQIGISSGGTSGRDEVAAGVARYFPSYAAFVRQVVRVDREIGYSFRPASYRPDSTDIIRRRSPTLVEFTTPTGRKGEGTRSRLLAGKLPIEGFLTVNGPVEEPDLLSAHIRLPSNLKYLTPIILSDLEAGDRE